MTQKQAFWIATDSPISAQIYAAKYKAEGYDVKGIVYKLSGLLALDDGETLLVLELAHSPDIHGVCVTARGMVERGTFNQMIFDDNSVAGSSVEGDASESGAV